MAILDLDFDLDLPAFTVSARLTLEDETLALVGPSGAGKTTVLRAVAGLAQPDRGHVALDGRRWFDAEAGTSMAPEERSVGLVFQDYALFPHLSVRSNVAFGNRDGGVGVGELLERFRISHLAAVKPRNLSGGERQRVALARALARRPSVLLLDEPLSALDAHTRAVVRVELRELLNGLLLPTIFITHDFKDATALADRFAVIADGRLRQVGSLDDLTLRPADTAVARVVGSNVLPAVAEFAAGGSQLTLADGQQLWAAEAASGAVAVIVAPWQVRLLDPSVAPPETNLVRGTVTGLARLGGRVEVQVGPLLVECDIQDADRLMLRTGAETQLQVPPEAITLVSPADA